MNIGIIGTGKRATAYVKLCTSDMREDINVTALADIDEVKMSLFAEKFFKKEDMPVLYTDYNQLLVDESIDAVIICTPDITHREITIATLKQNKHILLEKPIATTLEDCVAIYMKSMNYSKVFRMGFVLRYTNVYSKIKEIVSKGELGKLISIEAKETLGYVHAGSFFRRWHRFSVNNGGFLNAKCSHDMDILNWIAGVDPVNVYAIGSRTFFNKKEDAADKCMDCNLKNTCRYYFKREDFNDFSSIEDACVFNSDKDIVDHEVVSIEYENGLTVSFTVTMLSSEANRTMVIFGTDATLYADFMRGTIEVKYIHPANEVAYKFTNTDSNHGGGDISIYTNFIDSIRTDRFEKTNDTKAGIMSSAIALAAEICMKENRVINLPDLLEKMK